MNCTFGITIRKMKERKPTASRACFDICSLSGSHLQPSLGGHDPAGGDAGASADGMVLIAREMSPTFWGHPGFWPLESAWPGGGGSL